jgi:hypothetical protein
MFMLSLSDKTLKAQATIFRLAEHDYGWTRKALATDSGINYDTLGTYWRGETIMPLTALLRLCDLLPDHLLSRLLDPVGRHLATNEEHDGDLADLGREAAGFTAEFVEATSDGKVTPIERASLVERSKRLGAAAQSFGGAAA